MNEFSTKKHVEGYFEGTFYRSEKQPQHHPRGDPKCCPGRDFARCLLDTPSVQRHCPTDRPIRHRLAGTSIPAGGADLIMDTVPLALMLATAPWMSTRIPIASWPACAGNFGAWDSSTPASYIPKPKVNDLEGNRISLTLMQEATQPFDARCLQPVSNGGCVTGDPGQGDCTANPQSVIDPFVIDVFRRSGTTLALADFKVSNNSLFALPGGDVGIAAGIEWRRETFLSDDRDPRLDGTITWTDSVTGVFNESGCPPAPALSPDTSGARQVLVGLRRSLRPAGERGHGYSADRSGSISSSRGRMERIFCR